jgi:hypothetical protein
MDIQIVPQPIEAAQSDGDIACSLKWPQRLPAVDNSPNIALI